MTSATVPLDINPDAKWLEGIECVHVTRQLDRPAARALYDHFNIGELLHQSTGIPGTKVWTNDGFEPFYQKLHKVTATRVAVITDRSLCVIKDNGELKPLF